MATSKSRNSPVTNTAITGNNVSAASASSPIPLNTLITKRLHVSGLTPNITISDLSKRLSTFGTVKALDKFGEQDALGDVKKFGFVTIESTQGNLAKCMNLLSGTTWKGTKLRIGEARPDFRDRLEKERSTPMPTRLAKPKRFGGIYAPDMSSVTPENVHARPGWKVTPLGRMLHPVRMRPSHPLPMTKEKAEEMKREEEAVKRGKKRKRSKRKDPETRARRRTIDVTRWGSTHLKGVFLDAVVAEGGVGMRRDHGADEDVQMQEVNEDEDESEAEEDEEGDEAKDEGEDEPPIGLANPPVTVVPPLTQSPSVTTRTARTLPLSEEDDTLKAEATRSLNLLSSLFSGKNEDEWGDEAASIGSDVDVTKVALGSHTGGGGNDFEVVPREKEGGGKRRRVENEDEDDEEEEEEEDVDEEEAQKAEETKKADMQAMEATSTSAPTAPENQKQQQKPTTATSLKDLFAPRDEDAGFSLVGHLDLDLELDDEIPFAIPEQGEVAAAAAPPDVFVSTQGAPAAITASRPPIPTSHQASQRASSSRAPFLDPKKPLFFPHRPSSDPSSITKARPKDILEHFAESGWGWRQLISPETKLMGQEAERDKVFYRTGTEEEIRKRWEEGKVELTREWKRRYKEAGKFERRRRGGAGAGEFV